MHITLSWAEFPDLTYLIRRLHHGDKEAEDRFFRTAYRHLSKMAATLLRRERDHEHGSPQDLLHDVWVNRISNWQREVNDRNHYAALVSMALRDELFDRARRRNAQKRTAPAPERKSGLLPAAGLSREEILSLERELDRLAEADERAAQVVRLRFYGGCSWPETAHATGASLKAVRNDWEFAADWLSRRLSHKLF
jgi:RNA polymerase sigma factor (TIGR02999 family)